MEDYKFKVGDKVLITGDASDGTDHLDGKVGEVLFVYKNDIMVEVPCENYTWLIWNHNAELVETAEEANAPKYYNGKVVCVAKGYDISTPVSRFTVGKVYVVVDGVITSDTGYRSDKYREVKRLCEGMGWTFIPFVE